MATRPKPRGEIASAAVPKKTRKRDTNYPSFDTLPDTGYARINQLVIDPKHPAMPAPLPFGRNKVWRGVADGTFPQPVRLGSNTTCWKVGDVRAWMKARAEQGYSAQCRVQQGEAVHKIRESQTSVSV
jgi:prophage regulatory protein